MMEYKAVQTEIKAGASPGRVQGHYAIFDNLDEGQDITHKGAFTKTLQERGQRIKVFYGHDWDKLIAPPPDPIFEDDRGLYAEYTLVLDSFWGAEAWALIKAGALTEGSFGYEPIKAEYDRETGARHLRELKLYEISPVPLGMNPLTSIQAAKRGQLPPATMLEYLQQYLQALGNGQALLTAQPQQLQTVKASIEALAETLAEALQKQTADQPIHDHLSLSHRYQAAQAALSLLSI